MLIHSNSRQVAVYNKGLTVLQVLVRVSPQVQVPTRSVTPAVKVARASLVTLCFEGGGSITPITVIHVAVLTTACKLFLLPVIHVTHVTTFKSFLFSVILVTHITTFYKSFYQLSTSLA